MHFFRKFRKDVRDFSMIQPTYIAGLLLIWNVTEERARDVWRAWFSARKCCLAQQNKEGAIFWINM